jgi:MFS family permease
MSIAAVILLYVPNFTFFVFIRLFQGYCTGLLSSLAPLIIKELAPTEILGTLSSCHQIFITFGATFGFAFSLFLSAIFGDMTGHSTWWIVFGFPLIVVGVQTYFLNTIFKLETPKYLLLNNREQ